MSSRKPLSLTSERWTTERLASVGRLFVGLSVSRYHAKSGEAADEVPVLSVGDISEGAVRPLSEIPRVRLRPGSFERFRVQAGDLLMTCRGTVLKAAQVPDTSEVLIPSSNLIVIQPGDRLLRPLLLALLRGSAWQEILRVRSHSSSTGLIQLTLRDLEDLPVPVPPMEVQRKLAALMEAEEEHYRSALRAAALRRELAGGLVSDVLWGAPGEERSHGSNHV